MTWTWTSATLAGIDYYDQDLDIGDFILFYFSPASAIMVGMGQLWALHMPLWAKFLLLFFFFQIKEDFSCTTQTTKTSLHLTKKK